MHCSSHFEGQKWIRVIDLYWSDATLIFTYLRPKVPRTFIADVVPIAFAPEMIGAQQMVHLSANLRIQTL